MKNLINCFLLLWSSVNTHRYRSLVASSETASSKGRSRVSIHIWDYHTLETIIVLGKEEFGSDISLLSFSSKPGNNLILIVSRDKPKVLLFVDWRRNEIIYSITVSIIRFVKKFSRNFGFRITRIRYFRHYLYLIQLNGSHV